MESAFADKNFPLWVLSTVAVLTMPTGWAPLVILLFTTSLVYGYLKRNPGTLKDPKLLQRPEVQRSAILGMTWFLWLAMLPMLGTIIPSGSMAFPLLASFVLGPLLSYGTALIHALASWPRGAKSPAKEVESGQIESWTHASCAGFMTAFVGTVFAICWCPGGVGYWLSSWLLASGRDANLLGMREFTVKTIDLFGSYAHPKVVTHLAASEQFVTLVNLVLCLVFLAVFWSKAQQVATFLTVWLKRSNGKISANVFESLLGTARSEENSIELKNTKSFSRNLMASLLWIVCCYMTLLLLCGFSGGPIGGAISNWMDASLAKANMATIDAEAKKMGSDPVVKVAAPKTEIVSESVAANLKASRRRLKRVSWWQSQPHRQHGMRERLVVQQWIDKNGVEAHPNLRIFIAAIIALYGTVPLAVSGAVFLPYMRRKRIVLNKDGIYMPEGSRGFMGNKALRLWSELRFVDLKLPRSKNQKKGRLVIRFRDKGKVVLHVSQIQAADLESFLSAIDEHSPECIVSQEVLDLRHELRVQTGRSTSQEKIAQAEQFQSTIFRTHEPGTFLPDGETRVVRLLASRPLSCVYLVRRPDGKLAIAKQFYLVDNGEETEAMRKCLQREYELLGKIDHPSIARVLGVSQREESTYLLLEHVYGTDLRSLVSSQGARTEAQVYDWALQICEIMTYLHSQDPPIIHRDLTPDNLVLTEDGKIRVIDFGAAQRFMEGITGTIIGKQCYVPPEQLQGHAGVRSDIYSFAGVLQFLLTAEDPVALSQSDPSCKADVSAELAELVMRCSAFDEKRRPESFEKIKELLIEAREKPLNEAIQKLKDLALSQDIKPPVHKATPETSEPSEASEAPQEESEGVTVRTKELQEELIQNAAT